MNSLVGKYFDFGQALEFLKQSIPVTNELYNDKFRFELIDGVVYLTNYVHEFEGEFFDINGGTCLSRGNGFYKFRRYYERTVVYL